MTLGASMEAFTLVWLVSEAGASSPLLAQPERTSAEVRHVAARTARAESFTSTNIVDRGIATGPRYRRPLWSRRSRRSRSRRWLGFSTVTTVTTVTLGD